MNVSSCSKCSMKPWHQKTLGLALNCCHMLYQLNLKRCLQWILPFHFVFFLLNLSLSLSLLQRFSVIRCLLLCFSLTLFASLSRMHSGWVCLLFSSFVVLVYRSFSSPILTFTFFCHCPFFSIWTIIHAGVVRCISHFSSFSFSLFDPLSCVCTCWEVFFWKWYKTRGLLPRLQKCNGRKCNGLEITPRHGYLVQVHRRPPRVGYFNCWIVRRIGCQFGHGWPSCQSGQDENNGLACIRKARRCSAP